MIFFTMVVKKLVNAFTIEIKISERQSKIKVIVKTKKLSEYVVYVNDSCVHWLHTAQLFPSLLGKHTSSKPNIHTHTHTHFYLLSFHHKAKII